MELRRLTTPEDLQRVHTLEREIWGEESADDCVPVLLLLVSSRTGGLVIGAFDGDRLAGFAHALPGLRGSQPYLWSHMLGVAREYRSAGLGWRIKLEQRRLALQAGLALISWTFDPLQALNAHLNFAKLGVVADEYHLDAYPGSASPLHAGTPTDRFVADWWLSSPHAIARLDAATAVRPRPSSPTGLPPANRVRKGRAWLVPDGHDLAMSEPRLAVIIPAGFTEMQQQDLPLALAWRSATREVFTTYLSRGYRVTDFVLDRQAQQGTYVIDAGREEP
jgi:predicted GNAT superfamily acetyltransferase